MTAFVVTTETTSGCLIEETIEAPGKRWAIRLHRSLLMKCKGWEPQELRCTVAEPVQEEGPR